MTKNKKKEKKTREKEISDGLEAASRGKRELEDANSQREVIVDEAKKEAADLLSQASQRANQMVEDAKSQAQEEVDRIKTSAKADLEQAAKKAREEIRSEVSALVVAGAEKVLGSEIDQEKNQFFIEQSLMTEFNNASATTSFLLLKSPSSFNWINT